MSNKGPKNFRNIKFPPARGGTTNATYAPLPPIPPAKIITPNEVEKRALQLKEMKKFINEKRCPICSAQLEGMVSYNSATVYCLNGGESEYRAQYKLGLEAPFSSVTTFYTNRFAFEIANSQITDDLYKNSIYEIDLSLSKGFQQKNKKKILEYEGNRLSLPSNLTEEQILSKIKLYTVFS